MPNILDFRGRYPVRSPALKRAEVAALVVAAPHYSDRQVAELSVVSRELVRVVRSELLRVGSIDATPLRLGRDGRTYPLRKVGAR